MKEAEFSIRTKKLPRKVALLFLPIYILTVVTFLCFSSSPNFPAQVSAYAQEILNASSGFLEIPSISLSAPVSTVSLSGRTLQVPDYIVGKYQVYENKVLLMGHSSTVFLELKNIKIGDQISYGGQVYQVISKEVRPKAEISMKEILKDEDKPMLTLMTCSGEHISNQDYSHRLIIDAVMSSE